MKKIILFLLLVIPLILRFISSSEVSLLTKIEKQGYSKKEKDINWEFIKDKLFKGTVQRNFTDAKKFEGPILFSLKNGSLEDSLAVLRVIKKLRVVIPNKEVDFFSDFTKQNFKSFVKNRPTTNLQGYSHFDVVASTLQLNFEVDKYQNKRGANKQKRVLYFSFNESTPVEERIKYIQFEVLRTICFVDNVENSSLFLNLKYPLEATFNDPSYTFLDKQFTELDQFLVSKLYSNDFKEQFSTYMYQTYPWRYANVFLNKKATKTNVYIVISILFLLIGLLSFTLFYQKKASYSNYLFPVLIVFLGSVNLQFIYQFFAEIK